MSDRWREGRKAEEEGGRTRERERGEQTKERNTRVGGKVTGEWP